MPLSAGARLGPYEIVAPLGAGGMGEVYQARDTRLDRSVAVKVLPAHVSADAERRSRFEREARAIAKLNHPNILAIHDVGESDGVRFIVTELVDGEPVRGPLPVRRLLETAAQIADGLAAAHEAGIVHRDVKPDNILVGRDGRVKILDFGLAREALQPADGSGVTQAVTSAGTVLGTVAYMSPEQARGGLADARSDQFSFGLVLYELASGRRAFVRDSAAQTLSAIIEAEPDAAPLAALPTPLRWIVERCLAKDPAERYASTADLYRDLRHLRGRQAELSQSGTRGLIAPPVRRPHVWPALAVLSLVAAAAVLFWPSRGDGPSLDVYRFVPFAVDQGVQSTPAWSPDGLSLAFSGEVDGYSQIFVRRLDQSTPSQLTGLGGDCTYPMWDAEGTRVFFVLAQDAGGPSEVWVVSAAGGAPERLIENTPAFTVAPDGDTLLFLAAQTAEGTARTYTLRGFDLQTRSSRDLAPIPAVWDGGYHPTSRSIGLAKDGSAFGVVVPGSAELVLLPNPLAAGGGEPRRVRFTTAQGGVVSLYEFAWMPDSRHVLFNLRDPLGGDQSIWLGDIERGTVTRVTASTQWESTPAVSPDGSRIAFGSTPLDWDILEVDLSSGARRPLVASSRYDGWGDWMPDGSGLVFSTQRTGRFEIWAQSFRDGAVREVVTPDDFPGEPSLFLVQGAVSPDGRSVAYVRFASGGARIYVSALAGSRPVQLTSDPAALLREDDPAWSPDGRWISFRRGDRLMKALASGGTVPALLAEDVDEDQGGSAQWLPDGAAVVYRAADGLKRTSTDGAPARQVSPERPLVWDLSPDGRVVYAILERERRAIDLVTIDISTGDVRTLMPLGRKPLTPDYNGYRDTLRAMRVSPDGTRLLYAYLNPSADIWILEGARAQGR